MSDNKLDATLLQGRDFQLWHYICSMGHALIRSPISPDHDTNIDLWFVGVKYLSMPRQLGEIELDEPTEDERDRLLGIVGELGGYEHITVIVSGSHRHFVVSSQSRIQENKLEIFELPYDGPPGWLAAPKATEGVEL